MSTACNEHCPDCPFACHTEQEDGHTPEWLDRVHEFALVWRHPVVTVGGLYA